MPIRRIPLLTGSLLLAAAAFATGCEPYDGVPVVAIEGIENGLLLDNKAPLVVTFSEPVRAETLRAKVVVYKTDTEGNLADEDKDPLTELDVLVDYEAGVANLGTAALSEDGLRLKMLPELSYPIGTKLVLLIEPGLQDEEGDEFIVRERILFSYTVELKCAPSKDFVSGPYFFLGDVTQPIGVQVQLLSWIDVNPDTGEFVGSFVNADRNRDPARCAELGLSCTDKQACRTLPTPACVTPSEKAASPDEYPDYLVNYDPPAGFDFTVTGCVDGESGADTVFVNAPVDVKVTQPAVSLRATVLTASFKNDEAGVLRGTGAIVAENVLLGDIDSGEAAGNITARLIPSDEVPPGLKKPVPPPEEP